MGVRGFAPSMVGGPCRPRSSSKIIAPNRVALVFRNTPNLHVVRTAGGWSLSTCRHCEDAPCLNVCQPKAITRRGHEVIVDPDLCTGCSDCIPVCPFGAISIAPRRDSASQDHCSMAARKCDLCQGSADGPACVRACPNGALRLVDPESERRQKGVQAVETLIALSKL